MLGEIDSAMDQLTRTYPHFFDQNKDVQFDLHCLKFLQLVKRSQAQMDIDGVSKKASLTQVIAYG